MERKNLFKEIIEEIDLAYDLMNEYDSLLHQYGDHILYQEESHLIQCIGRKPGITNNELTKELKKTKSACSQMVKKLIGKNWVIRERNVNNNREYYLFLTEEGQIIFEDHEEFDKTCLEYKYRRLEQFSEKELEAYLKVQKVINDTFQEDVEKSYDYFKNK